MAHERISPLTTALLSPGMEPRVGKGIASGRGPTRVFTRAGYPWT
jgi:hypothetical protein